MMRSDAYLDPRAMFRARRMVKPSTVRMYPSQSGKNVLREWRWTEPGDPPGHDDQRQANPESPRSVGNRGGGPPRGNMMKHIHRSIPPAPQSSLAPPV